MDQDVAPVQIQFLASFSLKGEVGYWWEVIQIDEQKCTGTWDDFEYAFDEQYVSEMIRSIKKAELLNLEEDDMSVQV